MRQGARAFKRVGASGTANETGRVIRIALCAKWLNSVLAERNGTVHANTDASVHTEDSDSVLSELKTSAASLTNSRTAGVRALRASAKR